MARENANQYQITTDPESLQQAIVLLREDYDAHNHDGVSSKSFQTLRAETVSARVISIRKSSYTDTIAGLWTGLVGSTPKFYLGDATNYFKFTGSEIAIAGNVILGTTNYIRGGQTAFKTGDGIFFGYDTTPEKDQEFIATDNLEDVLICQGGSPEAIGINFPVAQGITNIYKFTADLKKNSGNSDVIYCDIYESGNDFKPTGASLGQTAIAGITNAAYETKEFIFASPVTVTTSKHYIAILSSPSTTTGIYISGTLATTRSLGHNTTYNGATWTTVASNASSFATYSQNVGYKFSVGNGTYQFSYNTNNVYLTSGLIVRDTVYSEVFGTYGADSITFGAKGGIVMYKMTLDSGTTGLRYQLNKSFAYGLVDIFKITPYIQGSEGATGIGVEIALGSRSNQSLYIYSTNDDNIRLRAKGSGYLVVGDLGNCEIGSSAHKATVFCSGLSACPLPSVDNALAKLATVPAAKEKSALKDPSLAHFELPDMAPMAPKRKYFDIDDVPEELTFITREGKKDIELIRVIGFCFQAIKELSTKVAALENKTKV